MNGSFISSIFIQGCTWENVAAVRRLKSPSFISSNIARAARRSVRHPVIRAASGYSRGARIAPYAVRLPLCARPRDMVFPGLAVSRLGSGLGLPMLDRLRPAPSAGHEAPSQVLAKANMAMREYGDMSLVLSHSTAMMVHRASMGPCGPTSMLPREPRSLKPGPVDMGKVAWARRLLIARGVPKSETESIDVLVLRDCDRRFGNGVVAHVWSHPIPPGSLIEIDKGIYVVSPLLCLQQMAAKLNEVELIELLLEACGRYALLPGSFDMVKRDPLVSVAELRKYCSEIKGQRGSHKLQRALGSVRDGARSPMETAFFMILMLPRRLGGEGLTDLEMAYRIDVRGSARLLTRRSYFECDAFLPRTKTDFEYNGIVHEEEAQFVTDAERINALEAMGYNVITITRRSFFDKGAFGRLMRAIELRLGRRSSRTTADFAQRQEELRRFVLRWYLDEAPDDEREAFLLAEGRGADSGSGATEVPWDYMPFEE